MKNIIASIIYKLDCFVPKNKNQIAFSSFPDISDNCYGMFRYLFRLDKNFKFIWLLSNDSNIGQYKEMISKDMLLNEVDFNRIFFIKKNSIQGIYYYLRSKYVFFTHGLYPEVKFSKDHILINLWHGMPLKKIALLDNINNKKIPIFSFTIATSIFFQEYMAKAFGVPLNNVMVSGQPRNDLLFEDNNCLQLLGIDKTFYKKIFLWTPTYRQSMIGDIRMDGHSSDGLPIIDKDYKNLNESLRTIDSYMIIKLHPMDILNQNRFDKYSNILFLTNDDLEKRHCQLYLLLNNIDVLITDFSSIYIDFLLLDRPIGFATEDFDEYFTSRGFIMEHPKEYMPGSFIASQDELFNFLKNCTEDKDNYKEKRHQVNNLFNDKKRSFSQRLWIEVLESEK